MIGVTDWCEHDIDAPSTETELKEHFAAMAEQSIRNQFLWLADNGYRQFALELSAEMGLALALKGRLDK